LERISFAAADFNNGATNCICEICAQYNWRFSGQINQATNATTKTVSLTGVGINPYIQILMM
jgi:hypothetical protein